MCCFVILTDKNFVNNYFNVFKTYQFPLKYTIANYNGEPRDIPNIYLIRIFSAIWLNDNWH
jgi:hypothetical protein